MSIDYEVDMSKFKYQVEYFFSYLLDSEVISDDLKIIVPSISTSTEVGIADLFVMLYLLSFSYEGVSDKIRRPEDTTSHKLDIVTPRVKYYEQLYRDDGDFDDYISWNEKFGKYIPPAPYDTMQFYFGTAIKQSSLDDDEEFNFGDIIYNLDYLQGEYDFDELVEEEPIDQDKGYDFIDPNFNTDSSDEEASDNRLYDFGDVYFIPPPTDGDRYDFNTLIDINPDEYFEQLLEEIRDIRTSERKVYEKVTELYATAYDYNENAEITKKFYAKVQNKLHYAVSGLTAPELIHERADSDKEHMGLTSWRKSPNGKVYLSDAKVAKNYLTEQELKRLNRLVSMYLDYAEDRAERHIPMSMKDWSERLDKFLEFYEYNILEGKGNFSRDEADEFVKKEYEKFKPIQDKIFKSDYNKFDEETKDLFDYS
jgi:hypothetical protein